MDLQLSGKRALVSGSTSGIGAVVATQFAGYINGANYRVDGGGAVSIN